MKSIFLTVAVLFLLVPLCRAQNISGDWQAAIGSGKDQMRTILHIDRTADGALKATFFSIDEGPDGIPVSSITQQGARVAFSITGLKLSYRGTVSSDGTSIAGKMTQDGTGSLTFVRPSKTTAWPRDIHCACSQSFIPAGEGVKLEVLDWGGTGRPLVLLAGLGNTAHVFDEFAHKLAAKYHVYGITRRGFGESSSPLPTEANYSADRLGDDVLAVMDALHLIHPVLVGHSIAGEELSSVGSQHPEKIAGLVYLDAAYGYAFYNPGQGDVDLDTADVRKMLGDLVEKRGVDKKDLSELIQQLPKLEEELRKRQEALANMPADSSEADIPFGPEQAMMLGQEKYTKISCPVLAIFADPHHIEPMKEYTAVERAAEAKFMDDHTTTHRSAFEAGVPSAHVVRVPDADHYVFKSNEADVLREMDIFIAKLPN